MSNERRRRDMLPKKWITKKSIPRCLCKVSHNFVTNLLYTMLGIRRKREMELVFKKYVLLVSLLLLSLPPADCVSSAAVYRSCWLVLLLT
jgi:hypothetical protein